MGFIAGRAFVWMVLIGAALPAADLNLQRTADYLDKRQKEWFAWPPAQSPGGACVSCHTGLPYLMVRPLLRRSLGEQGQTQYETGMLGGLQARLASGERMFRGKRDERAIAEAETVEAIVAVFAFTSDSSAVPEPAVAKAAWDRVWRVGTKTDGQWPWFKLGLHPWESDDSAYYGTTLLAVAAGRGLSEPMRGKYATELQGLARTMREGFAGQPLHNRVMALWAAARMPELLPAADRESLVGEIWQKQEPDGGWKRASLGPWNGRELRPDDGGSDAYSTALVTYVLQQQGSGCGDPRLDRAKRWLQSHANAADGAWNSTSMNKEYPAGSMQAGFMNDAATSFAALALLDTGACKQVHGAP